MSSTGFQVVSAFQPRPAVTPRWHLFLPLLSHWSISTLLSHSLFHFSRPHTFTSAKRFITAGCDLTPPPAFATVQKNCQGFFFFLSSFSSARPSNVPPSEAPEEMWHMDVITVWSLFLSLGLSVLKCSDVVLAVLLKALLFYCILQTM